VHHCKMSPTHLCLVSMVPYFLSYDPAFVNAPNSKSILYCARHFEVASERDKIASRSGTRNSRKRVVIDHVKNQQITNFFGFARSKTSQTVRTNLQN
jgi:hypothetical protein